MQLGQKATEDHNKRTVLGDKKHSGRRQKSKEQSMQQWGIKIPIDLQHPHIQSVFLVNNQLDKTEGIRLDEQNEQPMVQGQQLSQQLLSEFIREILLGKYHSQTLQRILNCARKSPLVQLWSIQYTNHLSLASHLLQNALSTTINLSNKATILRQYNQNKDESNIESEMVSNEGKRKKRKIKKSAQHKKQQNNNNITREDTIKAQTIENEFKVGAITNQQSISTINSMLQQIQQQILRLQHAYLQQMQNIHILPYIEAQTKLVESQAKSVKKSITATNRAVVNPDKYYPLQGLQKQHLGNNNNNANYGYSTNRTVFSSISYDYSMMGAQQQQHQQPIIHQQQQMRSQFNFPLMSMNQGFNQHLSHLQNHYPHNQGILPNNNNPSEYLSDRLMTVSNQTSSMTTASFKRAQDNNCKRSNPKTITIQQQIGNYNNDGDCVQVSVSKRN